MKHLKIRKHVPFRVKSSLFHVIQAKVSIHLLVPFAASRSFFSGLLLCTLLIACQAPLESDVRLHTVQTGTLELKISETGELGSAQEVWINSPFAGTLSNLLPEGSLIKAGQLIGKLETSQQELERSTAQLSLKEAQIDQQVLSSQKQQQTQEQAVNLELAQIDQAIENTRLKQLHQERDSVALTRVKETIRALDQKMKILELESQERSRLFSLGFMSKEEQSQAQLQLAEARKQREQLLAERSTLQGGPRPQELQAQLLKLKQSQALAQAAQKEFKIKQDVIAIQSKSAQAQIKKYQKRFGYYDQMVRAGNLSSKVSGTLVYGKLTVGEQEVPIKSGDAIQEGVQIVRIVDLAQPILRLMIHEIDAPQIKTGQLVRIRFDAWQDKIYNGHVTRILTIAKQPKAADKQAVKLFACEIRLDQPDPELRPGMTAQAEIITQQVQKAILVPTEAILNQGSQSICHVLRPGRQQAESVRVQTGVSDARMTEITQGLKVGDQVILNPRPESVRAVQGSKPS